MLIRRRLSAIVVLAGAPAFSCPLMLAGALMLIGTLASASSAVAEDWPQFRGPRRDNISAETGLIKKFPDGGPKVLWTVGVCQGYAGAAVHSGRVYFNDYDEQAEEWLVRCVTLADGKEQWRFHEKKKVRPNHGITRTVPVADGKHVFSLDQKCVFHCLDAADGKELWQKNLVADYGAAIPPWYNGQCPLLDGDLVVIAPGGEATIVAFERETGNERWRTPNPGGWLLSHSSLMPAEFGGKRQYLYCTLAGLMGVSADDGKVAWTQPYKFNVAVAPSPVCIAPDRVFMSAGYDAGGLMLRIKPDGDKFAAEKLFDLPTSTWNTEVHTPIFYKDHLFAVGKKKRGAFTCLSIDGKIVWSTEGKASFGLGSFLLADGVFFVLDGDSGLLRMIEASTTEYKELGSAQVLNGSDVWGPMALSDGRLILRDMTKMVCVSLKE